MWRCELSRRKMCEDRALDGLALGGKGSNDMN